MIAAILTGSFDLGHIISSGSTLQIIQGRVKRSGNQFPEGFYIIIVNCRGWRHPQGGMGTGSLVMISQQYIMQQNLQFLFLHSPNWRPFSLMILLFQEGTTHLVWATGPGPLFSLEGLDLSSAQHGFQRTQLLKNLNSVVRLPADTWSLLVTEEDNHVLSADTTYWCKVIRLPEAFRKKHHIVQVYNANSGTSIV